MLDRFCQGQNLRALFTGDHNTSTVIERLKSHFERVFNADVRGTLLSDILSFSSEPEYTDPTTWKVTDTVHLSPEITGLLEPWLLKHVGTGGPSRMPTRGIFQNEFCRYGQKFKTANASPRDSYVIYKKQSDTDWAAGQIRQIFLHSSRSSDGINTVIRRFLLVDNFRPLSPDHVQFDHYREFPVVGGQLFYDQFTPTPSLITSDEICCHFVHTPHTLPVGNIMCVHALPLDKVSCSAP